MRTPLSRPNGPVYSSTAASPRARTSSQIAATARSTSTSSAESNATSFASRSPKSACAVERRAISGMRSGGLRELVEERLEVVAPELERRLVDDEAGAGRADLPPCAPAGFAQPIAPGHQGAPP